MLEGREIDLLRPLGAGGFGVVWLARLRGRDGFTRRVAVKLMQEKHLDDEQLVGRQRDEARLLGLLQHPNIVQVLDLTEIRGCPAVVMEYVEGADVSSLVKFAGALPTAAAATVASGVAAALDAGWSFVPPDTGRPLRVIHRDIKPANVLVTAHGAVKVLDFGVARADFDREGHTQSMAFGTPRFMAPEQFLRGELTAANDVYALGVTLFEMLTGRTFEKPPVEREPHRRKVSELLEAAPEPFREGIGRMLAHRPEQRPTAGEVVAWLDDVPVDGESLRAYARRLVPTLIELREASMAQKSIPRPGASSGETPGPTAGPSGSASPLSLGSAGSLAATPAASGGQAPRGLPAPPSSSEPSPTASFDADSGVSMASPATGGPRALAWAAGGLAGMLLVAGVVLLGVGAAWWAGLLGPGTAPTEPAVDVTAVDPGTGAGSADGGTGSAGTVTAGPADEGVNTSSAAVSTTPVPAVSTGTPAKVRKATASTEPAAAPPPPASESTVPAAPAATTPEPAAPAPAAASATTAPAPPVAASAPTPTLHYVSFVADGIEQPVLIDGKKVGVTPLSRYPLAEGTYNLQVGTAATTLTVGPNTSGTYRYNAARKKWEWL